MDMKVLVAYASKRGATAEIARKVGEVLRKEGLDVDVVPAKQVSNPAEYQAVIIGSAAYMGMWRKEAVKLLKDNEKLLTERLVWIFSSGPTGEGDPMELVQGWRFPKAQQPIIERIKPRDIAVFHGKLDPDTMNFFEKAIIKNVKSAIGDFRDWNAITAWAKDIANALKKQS
jgi:menaquinone-dependent protoporphyrinogen oxidase